MTTNSLIWISIAIIGILGFSMLIRHLVKIWRTVIAVFLVIPIIAGLLFLIPIVESVVAKIITTAPKDGNLEPDELTPPLGTVLSNSSPPSEIPSSTLTSDYKVAIYWWQQSAEKGNSNAQYMLGWTYYYGHGVEQDYEIAVYWWQQSAEKGNAGSQNMLGWAYSNGLGVEQSDEQAVLYWIKAAEKEDLDAQYRLGWAYYYGRGVEQDYEKAFYWWQQSAEKGNSNAQYCLGWMYYDGY